MAASNRSTISTADAVHALVNENFRAISRAALDAAGAAGAERVAAEVAFEGWVAFVRSISLATFLDERISPEQNLVMSLRALDATVGRFADLGAPAPHR